MPSIREISLNPIFIIGIGIRITFILLTIPVIMSDWYVPFLDNSINNFSLDPWNNWIINNGSIEAFPYGFGMWIIFLPLFFIFDLFGLSSSLAYLITILIFDTALLYFLIKLTNNLKIVLLTYWLSPIIIILSYGLGLNDVIPVFLLAISIFFLKQNQLILSSALLAFSISAKLSMLVALPFFLIYIFNNKSRRQYLNSFIYGTLIFGAINWIPFVMSESAIQMLFGNQEMGKVFNFSVTFGSNNTIFIVPLLYSLLMYLGWRIRPLNFEIFMILIAFSFMSLVLLTPSSPGWFIWAIPFLVIYQTKGDIVAIYLTLIFSFVYLFNILFEMPLNFISNANFISELTSDVDSYLVNLLLMLSNTLMLAIGCLIALRMWRDEITQSNFFRFNRKPMIIGIAGDSGSGKDTLADSIEGLIGTHSTVKLSGDDYHKWDRQKPMWNVMTHINPMANDLQTFSNDLFNLRDGKSINQRRYDHNTGKMTKHFKVRSNRFIIASGLHTFSLPLVREACNIRIYLDIDEDLRRFYKIRRDTTIRGHSLEDVISSIESRETDSENFVKPQANYADLIMSLRPMNKDNLNNYNSDENIPTSLFLKIRNSYNELSLQRVLIGILGLNVDLSVSKDGSEISMDIEGDCSADDIHQAALILSPMTLEYLDENPHWESGMLGIMQIVIFSQISQLITKSISE